MKQTIKFGKVRLIRFEANQVNTYESVTYGRPRLRASVARVKSL